MHVSEIMATDVATVTTNTSVAEAARVMRDEWIGAIPVVEHGKMVGMVTDRDITIRVTAEKRDPEQTPVKQCMSEGVKYCFADESVDELTRHMANTRHRRLPVVNRDKRLVGIVSLGDLAIKDPVGHLAETALQGICSRA